MLFWIREGDFYETQSMIVVKQGDGQLCCSLKVEGENYRIYEIEKNTFSLPTPFLGLSSPPKPTMYMIKKGDFYFANKNHDAIINRVCFKCFALSPLVTLSLERYETGITTINLATNDIQRKELADILKQFFVTQLESMTLSSPGDYTFVFDEVFLKQFKQFAVYLNNKYNQAVISSDMLAELQAIHHSLTTLKMGCHIIPSYLSHVPFVNPKRKSSKELTYLLSHAYDQLKKDKSLPNDKDEVIQKQKKELLVRRRFQYLLADGEDPNQSGSTSYEGMSFSPFFYLICYNFDLFYLKLLILYGGNPFQRPFSMHGNAPFELALEFQNKAALGLFTSLQNRLERSMNKFSVTKVSVNTINTYITDTRIYFNDDNLLRLRMKEVCYLRPEEKAVLFKIFSQVFEVPDAPDKLRSIFDEDFSGNKFIEILYYNKNIIGFNLWEIVYSGDKIALHCIYALLLPSPANGAGLMTLLAFMPAYSLQMIFPKKQINIFYCSASHHSFRQAEGTLYSPKYQTQTNDQYISYLLNYIFRNDLQMKHDGLAYYVNDQLCVKNLFPIKGSNLLSEFFYQVILDLCAPDKPQSTTRSSPVFFPIGNESFSVMRKIAEQINLDLHEYVLNQAEAIRSLIHRLTHTKYNQSKLTLNSILNKNCNDIFYNEHDSVKDDDIAAKY